MSNSAAILQYPEMTLEAVRPGIILYGIYPSHEVDRSVIDLRPAMSLKANIVLVKDVEPGISISYGRKFTTRRPSRIATVPIGYADGYSRLLSNKSRVLINGQYAPVVRICMDQLMVDITDIEVKAGDKWFSSAARARMKSPPRNRRSHRDNSRETICVIGKRIPRYT